MPEAGAKQQDPGREAELGVFSSGGAPITRERWSRLKRLFGAALEIPSPERARFLDSACEEDPDLRAELERLLAGNDEPSFESPFSQLAAHVERYAPGDNVAQYRIEAFLGEGGMGVVYKAIDTRLGRSVALKFVKLPFGSRSEREARAVAALNHPNICTLYDVGPEYLVMEFVEGQTLAERMQPRRGKPERIPVKEALEIARQIAEALDSAHENGIVHRDLKPSNIKICPNGAVKVLDFGLAKNVGAPSETPIATKISDAGMILGTAAYMSPEQATGKPVDKRADIWSFAVVLYEMLTGRRLFGGATVTETLAEVLKGPIDLDALPRDTPSEIRDLLRRCLDRNPRNRLRDIGEARVAIEAALAGGSGSSRPEPMVRKSPWWLRIIAAALVVALAAAVGRLWKAPSPHTAVVRFTVGAPDGTTFVYPGAGPAAFAVSPDGKHLIFDAQSSDGIWRLWVRSLDSLDAQPLAGTEDGTYPFFSPDSKSVGFFSGGKLKRTDLAGGSPQVLADASPGRGGSWSPDGTIVFAPSNTGFLQRVSASGGVPVAASRAAPDEKNHRLPWFLPDGRHFLFTAMRGPKQDLIRVGLIDALDSKPLIETNSHAIYADGRLLFLRNSTLFAQTFDPVRLALTGAAIPIAEHVMVGAPSFGAFAASPGLLVFQARTAGLNLAWLDRNGTRLSNVGEPFEFRAVNLSPNQKQAAVRILDTISAGRTGDLWIYELARGARTRFTFDQSVVGDGVWSPDGRSIVYASKRNGAADLYMKAADGTGPDTLLFADENDKLPASWSQDGKYLLYNLDPPGASQAMPQVSPRRVWVLPLTADHKALKPFPFQPSNHHQGSPQFSPDGRWVSYQSLDSGELEVYVAPFPGPGPTQRVSLHRGSVPRWRADGREIFFLGPGRQLMAAGFTSDGGKLTIGEPHALFGQMTDGIGLSYDVSPDGQRFLAVVQTQQSAAGQMTVVQDWTAGLK